MRVPTKSLHTATTSGPCTSACGTVASEPPSPELSTSDLHSLHFPLKFPWLQKAFPPHSLHAYLFLPCWQRGLILFTGPPSPPSPDSGRVHALRFLGPPSPPSLGPGRVHALRFLGPPSPPSLGPGRVCTPWSSLHPLHSLQMDLRIPCVQTNFGLHFRQLDLRVPCVQTKCGLHFVQSDLRLPCSQATLGVHSVQSDLRLPCLQKKLGLHSLQFILRVPCLQNELGLHSAQLPGDLSCWQCALRMDLNDLGALRFFPGPPSPLDFILSIAKTIQNDTGQPPL
jgi:hypothetical protein